MASSERIQRIRDWAHGAYDVEAGVELLARSGMLDRGFADAWGPEIIDGFDQRRFMAAWVGLSGAEDRLVTLAANLLGLDGYRQVDIADLVVSLDRRYLHLMLAALAHAGGSHQHGEVSFTDTGLPVVGQGYLAPLVAWPDPDRLD